MLTIIADENIANLDDYMAFHNTRIIKLKGRDINQQAIDRYRPHALFIRSVTPITADTISDFINIRFIGSATIGTDHVNQDHLNQHGIAFANAKGCSRHSVAQYVITAILSLRPEYQNKPASLGIIGLGNIGSTLAKYAKDLGWHILGYDPFLAKSDLNNSQLDDLLQNSDIVSIHTPLTKGGDHPTHQLFSKAYLSKLQNNAMLINSARGEIIHQEDLLTAITQKNLQVVLDVFPDEPNIDKVLLDQLVIATPHIAGYTLEGKLRGTDMIYQAFCHHFNLPILQHLKPLLPPNPHTWANFKYSIHNRPTQPLKQFYDICQDDINLRTVGPQGVHAIDFDNLRKNYALRREWVFDDLNSNDN